MRILGTVHPLRSLLSLLGACLLAGVLVAGVLFPVVGGLGLLSNRASDTVDSVSAELANGTVPQTSVMLASDGSLLATFWGSQRRTVVPGDQISPAMKRAIVSIEDRRFYEHTGVDYRGTARAALNNANGDATQGGSTLTQQYVKNYLLLVVAQNDLERRQATEVTPARKLREIRIALAIDQELGKDEILTRYLNLVPFGNGAYGIEAAAQTYFGLDAKDLTLTQSAMLAGMVQSSSALNPYTNAENVLKRRNLVLTAMTETGSITAADAATAKAAPLGVLAQVKSPANGCLGAGDRGFFCDYARQYLDGLGIDSDALSSGGYVVKTTLDPVVQASVKAATNRDVAPDQPNVANVMDVVQPGQDKHRVLAMASSRTYGLTAPATTIGETYVPVGDGAGSVFKIFTAAAAMQQGLVGINSVLDTPRRFEITGFGDGGAEGCPAKTYCVENYNNKYELKYSLTQALAKSPNTAFVKLITEAGVKPTVDMAVKLGMRSLDAPGSAKTADNPTRSVAQRMIDENSASFTLGVNPVNMVELANVGATLSSTGMWCPPSPIESVTDVNGTALALNEEPCSQVIEPGLARSVSVALSEDDQPGGTSARAASNVGWNFPMSGKTGTTNSFRSAAFLGFTNTIAASNIVFDDSLSPQRIGVNNFAPYTCALSNKTCTVTGGTTPAHTWFSALTPVVGKFGDIGLPEVDPKYVKNVSAGGNGRGDTGGGGDTRPTQTPQAGGGN